MAHSIQGCPVIFEDLRFGSLHSPPLRPSKITGSKKAKRILQKESYTPNEMAENALEQLAKEMTPSNIEEAKKRAKICLESEYKQCD